MFGWAKPLENLGVASKISSAYKKQPSVFLVSAIGAILDISSFPVPGVSGAALLLDQARIVWPQSTEISKPLAGACVYGEGIGASL